MRQQGRRSDVHFVSPAPLADYACVRGHNARGRVLEALQLCPWLVQHGVADAAASPGLWTDLKDRQLEDVKPDRDLL